MSGFDLSKVIEQAKGVQDRQSDSNRGDQPRLVYPGPGEIKVKLLINPKSGIVARQTRRHDINGTKFICPNMYSEDCATCISLKSIETALGKKVPWTLNSKFRGVSYAQYVGSSSDYDWSGGAGEPKVGELILFMYPWSVYSEINELIASAGVKADQLISLNESKVFIVKRGMENNRVVYKVTIDPFESYKSFDTDDEFNKFLQDTPDLMEAAAPREVSEDMMRKSQEVASSLEMTYLGKRLGNNQGSPMSAQQQQTQQFDQNTYQHQPAPPQQQQTQQYQQQNQNTYQHQSPQNSPMSPGNQVPSYNTNQTPPPAQNTNMSNDAKSMMDGVEDALSTQAGSTPPPPSLGSTPPPPPLPEGN